MPLGVALLPVAAVPPLVSGAIDFVLFLDCFFALTTVIGLVEEEMLASRPTAAKAGWVSAVAPQIRTVAVMRDARMKRLLLQPAGDPPWLGLGILVRGVLISIG